MAGWTTGSYPKILEKFFEKKIDASSDAVTAHLTNTTPSTSHEGLADITEIATGGGYTQGTGLAVTVASSQMNGNTYELTFSGTVGFTASGAVAAFRYLVFCFGTVESDPILGYLDLGSSMSMNAPDQLSVDLTGVKLSVAFS